jgi:hypothetical protein
MYGFTDSPVERSEDDKLKVSEYTDSLASFIQDCPTPMTIALQGDWGSGKTSMMNMIRNLLGERVIPIWFNTWQYSQFGLGSNLSIALLSSFLEKVGAADEEKALLSTLSHFATGFGKVAGVAIYERVAGHTNAHRLAESLDEHLMAANPKGLETLRERISLAVEKKVGTEGSKRVVVFIDDLDRLAPESAIELLESLKLFMDVRHCVFVLAVDYGIVTQGLEKKFGKQIGHAKGRSFFDKIIQLPFSIPVERYDITQYIHEFISGAKINANDEEVGRFRSLIDTSIGGNPRAIKRLFNAFLLLTKVAERKGVIDVRNTSEYGHRIRILFAAQCLQMAFESIYEWLIRHIDDIDEDILRNLCDAKELASLDEKIRKSIELDDSYLARAAFFMEEFVDSIQIDDDRESISEEEIRLVKETLALARLTSSVPQTHGKQDESWPAFWHNFLSSIRGKSSLFQHSKGTAQSFLTGGQSTRKGAGYEVSVSRKEARAKVFFYGQDSQDKKNFDLLFKRKDELEAAANRQWEWSRKDGAKYSFVIIRLDGVNVRDPLDWPRIVNFLIAEINVFFNVFEQPISQLPDLGESDN